MADLIDGITPVGDMVARVGGDRFAVCCEDVADIAEACAIADRVHQVLSVPFRFGGQLLNLSLGIGVAVGTSSVRGEVLLRNAEAAMQAAKRAGRGRTEIFDDESHQRARRRFELGRELDLAIDAGELVTWFQPEVDLVTGALFGFEALVRWQHPERGLVPPDDFISIAEERGVIGRIGSLVLADACAALASWSAAAPGLPLTVSVNVSAHQLADPGLAASVTAAIHAAGVRPDQVCLEVTESALMDVTSAGDAVQALRETGVALAIDDFGTGYSSLSRLKRLHVDYLKIDREFVAGLGRNPDDDKIVAAVVGLGRSLGIRLIAEGIETEGQLAALVALGCDVGQGYLWAKPLPLAEATMFMERSRPLRHPG